MNWGNAMAFGVNFQIRDPADRVRIRPNAPASLALSNLC